LRHLVEALEAAAGSTASVQSADKPLGDVEATYADIARAKDELGWEPQVELKPGLRTVIEFLRDAKG
jgi:nucleoside-diphosphate-sugar epimerase